MEAAIFSRPRPPWEGRRGASMRAYSTHAGDQVPGPGGGGPYAGNVAPRTRWELRDRADDHEQRGPGGGVLQQPPDRGDDLGAVYVLCDCVWPCTTAMFDRYRPTTGAPSSIAAIVKRSIANNRINT